ncbi:MAG TPA: serine protease [Planctomycetaceae bacterium]|nr:serine protease [Planctomycetaceae bacterium]
MRGFLACFSSAVVGGLVVCLSGGGPLPGLLPLGEAQVADRTPGVVRTAGIDGERLTPDELVNVAVYERVNRAVVHITTRSYRDEGFFLFGSGPVEGNGSGFVVDKSGHIVTNFHVIEDARAILVTLYNGETYTATIVGADAINDVAVIKIPAAAKVLWPVVLGDATKLKVGRRVFAIGNPFGLERTLTTGVVSSLNRSLQLVRGRTMQSIIQTDAAINPGSSGGPLLNSRGDVIGMSVAIFSKTGQSSGVGFAIPANLINRVVPQLLEHGRVIRPDLGITRVYQTETGLMIAGLKRGGPAERAGLRGPRVVRIRRGPLVLQRMDRTAADLVTAIDGQPVRTFEAVLEHVEKRKPGDRVVLTVVRGGRRIEVPVQLGSDEAEGRQPRSE